MKLTKTQLRKIIREELLKEGNKRISRKNSVWGDIEVGMMKSVENDWNKLKNNLEKYLKNKIVGKRVRVSGESIHGIKTKTGVVKRVITDKFKNTDVYDAFNIINVNTLYADIKLDETGDIVTERLERIVFV